MTKVAAEFISEQLQGLTCDLTWRNNNEGTSDLAMDRDQQSQDNRLNLKAKLIGQLWMGHLFDQVFGEAKHKGLEKQIEKRIDGFNI